MCFTQRSRDMNIAQHGVHRRTSRRQGRSQACLRATRQRTRAIPSASLKQHLWVSRLQQHRHPGSIWQLTTVGLRDETMSDGTGAAWAHLQPRERTRTGELGVWARVGVCTCVCGCARGRNVGYSCTDAGKQDKRAKTTTHLAQELEPCPFRSCFLPAEPSDMIQISRPPPSSR